MSEDVRASEGGSASAAARPRLRFAHLDGLRAAASVYVVVFHAVIGFQRGELTGAWRLLKRGAAFGHEAVAVFIVLSGYCLMLPIARSGGEALPRGFGSFIGRRAFRILPPYYASVVFSLLLLANVSVLQQPGSRTIWDDSLPGLAAGPVVSHLLLVHNWFPEWAFQINGPLWSVATEWQIYFLFPLLLLPLWRRFGLLACLVGATALGYAPLAFYAAGAKTAIPWYLALFALGMGAAAIAHGRKASDRALHARVSWGRVTFVLWAASGIGGWFFGSIWFQLKSLTDLLLGLATATLLVHLASELEAGKPSLLTRWLGSRPAVAVGHMSYSLYLTHLPVLALLHFAFEPLALAPGVHALALLAVGLPFSLLLAWLFYLAIERPCMGVLAAPARTVEPTAGVARP
jgi:peptidoglycan/LPS O-acetylase OafA/YrhL